MVKRRSQAQKHARAIGRKLRYYRRCRQLTQKQLIDFTVAIPGGESLYRQLICQFESGKRQPTITQLQVLAQVLGVELSLSEWLR